jgi:hypothetical protein
MTVMDGKFRGKMWEKKVDFFWVAKRRYYIMLRPTPIFTFDENYDVDDDRVVWCIFLLFIVRQSVV